MSERGVIAGTRQLLIGGALPEVCATGESVRIPRCAWQSFVVYKREGLQRSDGQSLP